jgi:hypothetical protein
MFGNMWQVRDSKGKFGIFKTAVFVDIMTDPSGHVTRMGVVAGRTSSTKFSQEIGKKWPEEPESPFPSVEACVWRRSATEEASGLVALVASCGLETFEEERVGADKIFSSLVTLCMTELVVLLTGTKSCDTRNELNVSPAPHGPGLPCLVQVSVLPFLLLAKVAAALCFGWRNLQSWLW